MPMLYSKRDLRDRIQSAIVLGSLVSSISRLTAECSSLLDVGCGANSPLRYIRFHGTMIGLDAHEPSIEASREKSIHGGYIHADVEDLQLPADSFDAVVALEVLEHLPKGSGVPFLANLERIARKIVIISTPNGFVAQGPSNGNFHQRHLSGWRPAELRALGYTVRGINGLKPLRGEGATIAWRPRTFWAVVSRLTDPLVWFWPDEAFGLLSYKRL
jgi:2-polyprenyl-3-methyl-5-hydroxy-6-metoxy-1,4-benzoquinol methylase